MEEDRLIEFLKSGLENNGAVVDRVSEDLIETLMPQDLAKKMGLREHQLFGLSPLYQQDPKVEYISYNSENLERFSCLIDDKGFFTVLICPPDIYLKKKGLEKLVSEKISFHNSAYRFLEKQEAYNSYIILNFKYTAISEDKQDGILPVVINEHTLASPAKPEMFLAGYLKGLNPVSSPEKIPSNLLKPQEPDQVFNQACGVAKRKIEHVLSDFKKSLTRQMKRDIDRLNEYYQTIIKQIEQKIDKRQLINEEKEKEESRIQATKLELKRKALDQQKRYSLKIGVDLINVLRVYIPVVSLEYEVLRKQARRNISIIWNPLVKDLELPVCESCFADAGEFSLCDRHLHLVCSHCYFKCPVCKKYLCKACHPRTCPGCSNQGLQSKSDS